MGEDAEQAGEAVAPRQAEHPLALEAERVAASLSGKLGDVPAAEPESSSDNHASTRAGEGGAARPSVVTTDATPHAAGATPDAVHAAAPEADEARAGGGAEARGGVRGRAAVLGASVGESLKPRVERLREASSVVIDEAADDPGVRFLVIAAVLFLLFLLLWLLSFTLG